MLASVARPVIVVVWADTARDRDWLTLRASVPVDGRAITLYEEVHPLRHYNTARTHRQFLDTLHRVLPAPCRPVNVTDAGFRGPWFRQVESYGWDWVGSICNRVGYFNPGTRRWRDIHSLYSQATTRVRHLGCVIMSKQRRYACRLYLVRAYRRGPGRARMRENRGTNVDLYRNQHRAPWLLATSLPHRRGAGIAVKAIYAKRMGIEEAFRDGNGTSKPTPRVNDACYQRCSSATNSCAARDSNQHELRSSTRSGACVVSSNATPVTHEFAGIPQAGL